MNNGLDLKKIPDDELSEFLKMLSTYGVTQEHIRSIVSNRLCLKRVVEAIISCNNDEIKKQDE